MEKCKCGREIHLSLSRRQRIREFKQLYPWVQQKDLAVLFSLSPARISEIIRSDISKGGW